MKMSTKESHMVVKRTSHAGYTVPGLTLQDGHKVGAILQARLHALNEDRKSVV